MMDDMEAVCRNNKEKRDRAYRLLEEAVSGWVSLRDRIRTAGMPPHPDYWHQSVDEAEQKLRAALEAAKGAG